MYFETPEMSQAKALKFKKWFNREIGTDYDENIVDQAGARYYVLMDLEPPEIDMIEVYLNNI